MDNYFGYYLEPIFPGDISISGTQEPFTENLAFLDINILVDVKEDKIYTEWNKVDPITLKPLFEVNSKTHVSFHHSVKFKVRKIYR